MTPPIVVLAIDVGLKNLSLCIMTKEGKSYKILLWDNYNLLDKDPEMCSAKTQAGKECSKVASIVSCGNVFLCKVHSKKATNIKSIPKCKAVKSYLVQDIARIVLYKITELYLENKVIFDTITKVLIENQPRINNKMKIVSTLILGKLTELLSPKVAIRFISASTKLRIGGVVNSNASKTGTKGAKGYSNRKKLSVEYTRAFLKNNNVQDNESWLEFFKSKKKLNDMADSLGFCVFDISKS